MLCATTGMYGNGAMMGNGKVNGQHQTELPGYYAYVQSTSFIPWIATNYVCKWIQVYLSIHCSNYNSFHFWCALICFVSTKPFNMLAATKEHEKEVWPSSRNQQMEPGQQQ
jgi:hypothetical protein